MVCSGAIKKAVRRSQEASKACRVATEAMWLAEAEWARLEFLRFAHENPQLKGFSFRCDYEYNDEGYDLVTYVSTDPEEVNDDYAFSDLMSTWESQVLAVLCGLHSSAQEGSCTVAAAKKKRF